MLGPSIFLIGVPASLWATVSAMRSARDRVFAWFAAIATAASLATAAYLVTFG